MGFQQAVSGLNAATRNIEAIGNNVSNASTVGFKAAELKFSDIYAASVAGSGNGGIGIGVAISEVGQLFTQGNLSVTNNPFDLGISGEGLFRLSSNGENLYSRNGQFQLDKLGYLVNSAGDRLTGYTVDTNGSVLPSAPIDLQLSQADLEPKTTTKATIATNLDARKRAITSLFDPTNPATYTSSTSFKTYDTLGNAHDVTLFMVKTDDATRSWTLYGSLDNDTTSTETTTALATLTFDSSGKISAIDPAGTSIPTSTTALIPFQRTLTNGADNIDMKLDLLKATSFGTDFSVSALQQNGYAPGRLLNFNIASDGTIVARYYNGQSRVQGQVALATFPAMQGLKPVGGNNYTETSESGQPLIGPPGVGTLGLLQSGAVEESNVDLTGQLVNMITAQRNYQANAQTIKTQDSLLQTLINLR